MGSFVAKAIAAGSRPVRASAESERIFALPRRTETTIPPSYFERFRRTPAGLGNLDLRPKQAQVLYELAECGGAMASLALGEGKTGVGLLAGAVLGARCTVYLVSPALQRQILELEYPKWAEHWWLPELGSALHVVKYTDLRSKDPAKHGVLAALRPDLIVADEAHCLARASVQARRVARYQRAAKPKRLNLSGSFMDHTIREPAPLAAEALGEGSPYPRDYPTMESWAFAIDEPSGNWPSAPAGVLAQGLCPGVINPSIDELREGFRLRVAETTGFVVSSGDSCGAALELRTRDLAIPGDVTKALGDLRRLWVRPDGVLLASPLEFTRCAATLALGFYLRWTEEPPQAWREARSAWVSELNAFLSSRSRPGLDSPALVTEAAASGDYAAQHYAAWAEIEGSYTPRGEAVWLDYFAVRDAGTWALERPGIVWTEHPAFGQVLADTYGLPWYGGGTYPELDERGKGRSFAASVPAHHEGKNLQFLDRALITTPRPSARRMGQTIGRVHRQGQRSDKVSIDLYAHTPEYVEALAAARSNAAFLQATAGELQKLCVGTWV